MITVGSGPPVVLLPGIQGRWEWARMAVEALARRHRVVAYSLCDEPTSGFACDPAVGFENFPRQLVEVLDRAGLRAATIIGVSFGGLIAAEFAARYPERTTALVLASALPIGWEPDARVRFYMRAPLLLSPMFAVTSPWRVLPEVAAALPGLGPRLRFSARLAATVLGAPAAPPRMARRIRWASAHRFANPGTITTPTLVVTGEPGLDRVVPVEVTRRVLEQIPGSRHAVLRRTGHIGLVTRPGAFADMVSEFIDGRMDATGASAPPSERKRAS